MPAALEPPAEADWRLRAYQPGDEGPLREGFERVYGRPLSEASWRWKLKTRPSPAENLWLAVDRDDRPVFHYAGIPGRLHLPTGTFDALVGVDYWTLPEYRRRGIFTRCASWVHEHWRRAGVVGLLGAPNEQFGSRRRYLGWRHLFPLRWLIRPLRPEAIAARRLGVSSLGRIRAPGMVWNRLWDRRSPIAAGIDLRVGTAEQLSEEGSFDTGRWGFEHGSAWARWRYLECPHHDFQVLLAYRRERLTGYVAWRLEEQTDRRFAYIAELTCASRDAAVRDALISAAIDHCLASDAVAVATLAMPGTDLYRAWRRRGFLLSWGSFGIHCLPFSDEMSPAALRDPRRWDLVGGDFDVI
ncbi:MAG: GNAT family N-acetyltransferase [Acidobacteriota bacterium]